MRRIALWATLVAAALSMSAASATSLGVFDDVVSSGQAQPAPDCAPVVDEVLAVPDFPVEAVAAPLPAVGALATLTLTSVDISSIGPDCAGMEPVLVLIGTDPGAPAPRVLTIVDDLDVLGAEAAVSRAIAPSPAHVLPPLTIVTEIRVVVRPVAA